MALKDDPACYHAEYGIEEWNCEGEAEAIYNRDGEIIGYKSLCPTCWEVREEIFEFPCHDKFCLGDQVIRLRGSQVAGHYRNMAKDPKWTFPPLRCEDCREWLRNVSQAQKSCDACGNIFVVGAGHFKHVKKHLGDPVIHSQRFCLRCDRLTSEERNLLVYKREQLGKLFKKEAQLRRSRAYYPRPDEYRDTVNPKDVLREKAGLTQAETEAILRVQPQPPRSSIGDMERYSLERSGDGKLRQEHLEKHLSEFRPPFNSLTQVLHNADRIMQNRNPGEVLTMVDKRGPNVKLELNTGTVVIYKSTGYVTIFPLDTEGEAPSRETFAAIASERIRSGPWKAPV